LVRDLDQALLAPRFQHLGINRRDRDRNILQPLLAELRRDEDLLLFLA
jgi:hypothetical protein